MQLPILGSRSAVLALAVAALMAAPVLAQGPAPPLPDSLNVITPFVDIATPYTEDFELGPGDFTAGGDPLWQHGEPLTHVEPVAGQGANMWGTNLAGHYENRQCGWIQAPPVDLSSYPPGVGNGATTARVLFRHWMHFEPSWDGGVLQASSDGLTWQVVPPVGGYTGSIISSVVRECLGVAQGEPVFSGPSGTAPPPGNVWRTDEFDVSVFLGGPLHLRWVAGTDTSVTRLGWYIDDVVVEVGAGARLQADLPQVDPEAGLTFTPLQQVYAEDFEFDEGGWVENGTGAWAWGDAVAPPLPTTGGVSMWGTGLDGAYPAGACSSVTSPAIFLPGADPSTGLEFAQLNLSLWRHSRSGYDGAVLQVSTDDGSTWSRVVPHGGYDRTLSSTLAAPVRECLGVGTTEAVWSGPFSEPRADEWRTVTVDLTPFLGNSVRLRFVFGSTATEVEHRGVYFDDVLLHLGAAGSVDEEDPLDGVSAGAPGWTVTGTSTSWEYGVPTSGPVSARPAWATDLGGPYAGNECGAIVSPPVDTSLVPGLGKLSLVFSHFFDSASTSDAGVVQVSDNDGATWNVVHPVGGYGANIATSARACLTGGVSSAGYVNNPTGPDYEDQEFDIDDYLGDTIRVRFAFRSDGSSHDLGWYLRGVQVTRGLTGVPLGAPEDPSPAVDWERLSVLADDRLVARLKAEPSEAVRAVVVGPARVGLAEQDFPTRADALAHLQGSAEPFFLAVRDALGQTGGRVLHEFEVGPVVTVTGDAAAMSALAGIPGVRALSADDDDSVRLVDPIAGEDTMYADNTGGRQLIQAEEIWAKGYRGAGIKIAVIDTGIDATHEAFRYADGSSRLAAWANCITPTDECNTTGTPLDDHGHGTHVAATAAGTALYDHPTYGFFQETGVAPEATLMVAKFLNGAGSGSFTDGIKSLRWAFAAGADITSNSWGSNSCSSGSSVIAAVHDLTDLGMLSVFAAGNNGQAGSGTVGSPGCGESALTVGAVDQNEVVAYFSSRGPCADPFLGTPSRICPDVVAKGVDVRSAIPRGGASWADASGYRAWSGTSMATPHVAGAAALAEQMKRSMTGIGWDTPLRVEEEVFKLTAKDLGSGGPDNSYGWGLVQLLNVFDLVDSADVAVVDSQFLISKPLLRQGDSADLAFSVRNFGGALATGTFRAVLIGPQGDETVLAHREATIGLLEQELVAHTFTVTSAVLHGEYTFRGTFNYTWTNTSSGEVHVESVLREGTFVVKRVFFDMAIAGFPAESLPLGLHTLEVAATNAGNENGTDVRFEFTVPDGYMFVPGTNYDPLDGRTQYADPAPDAVIEDTNFGRVTLVWNVGDVPVGGTFAFTTNLLAVELGQHRVLLVAKYTDGAGNDFSQSRSATQVVALPSL